MTATNHALSGALIGLAITQPAIALPLALASHFVLDAIPHYGLEKSVGYRKNKKLFHKIISTDAVLLSAFLIFILLAQAPALVFACVFLACAPDLAWAYRYVIQERFGRFEPRPKNRFNQWHVDIQTHSLKGIYVEVPYGLIVLAFVVVKLI